MCPKCGIEACGKHCLGRKKQPPHGPCTQAAGAGTDHPGIGRCKLHLGSTRNHAKAAQAVKARQAVAAFALPREIEPHQALLDALYRWAGMVTYLAGVIAEFDSDDELKQLSIGAGREKFERPAVWVDMYGAALKEQARVAKACVDAGIDERRIRLAEEHGRALDAVLRGVLGDVFAVLGRVLAAELGGMAAAILERIMRDEVPAIVRRRVMALAAASSDGRVA